MGKCVNCNFETEDGEFYGFYYDIDPKTPPQNYKNGFLCDLCVAKYAYFTLHRTENKWSEFIGAHFVHIPIIAGIILIVYCGLMLYITSFKLSGYYLGLIIGFVIIGFVIVLHEIGKFSDVNKTIEEIEKCRQESTIPPPSLVDKLKNALKNDVWGQGHETTGDNLLMDIMIPELQKENPNYIFAYRENVKEFLGYGK